MQEIYKTINEIKKTDSKKFDSPTNQIEKN